MNKHEFLWGSATSAYQVEGGNIWSDWAEWEKTQGLEQCGEAVRHYEKFQEDFLLAKKLGQNAQRFSIEWARLERQEGTFSYSEIQHYRDVIKTLRQLGLKIFLTLHHFTLPSWLAQKGGWENPASINYFLRYVELVVKELGREVDFWLTINEPLVLATEGYLYGHWPPQVKSYRRMLGVMKNLAQAHKQSYQLIHQLLPVTKVGLAHNFLSLEPLRPWLVSDKLACRRADKFWNRWLMELTSGCHDFLGVNYYFHQRAFLSLNPRRGFVGFADPRKLGREVSALGWEIYPHGLREVLLELTKRYHLPLYVTENGIDAINEEQRQNFIIRSTAAVLQAKTEGASVAGYFYWSWLDNYEWDKGYRSKFGLVAVDRQKFQRQPRSAAVIYAKICQSQG